MIFPVFAEPAAIQSGSDIVVAIRSFLESNFRQQELPFDIEIAPPDQRLQLAACSVPLEVFTPGGNLRPGNVSVGVRCSGDHPWTIYHKAFVRVSRHVAVLRLPVRQGEAIPPDALALESRDATQLRGGWLLPEQAVGKTVKRTLPAGTVLTTDHLLAAKLIRRGQQVTIRSGNAGFEVSMAGIALSDGEVGKRIRVRNVASERVVEGTVTGDGVVTVAP